MVVVREVGCLESTVYGSCLNKFGQLGLGDFEDRKVLTPVRIALCLDKPALISSLTLFCIIHLLFYCSASVHKDGEYDDL